LSGLQFNISGIIGPALGGLLVPLAGANFVFALNAACFLLVVVATRQWKQPALPAKLPSESFFESFGTIIRYARNVPGFQVVLARNFLFALFISVIPALMPVVGLKVLHLTSSNLGLLFTSMGAACLDLRVIGAGSADRGLLCCCGASRRGMDNVGFRTLGGGAAGDAGLGARTHERDGDHDLTGGDGAWGSDLGFGRRNSRSKLHLAWSGGSVPHEPASGPSAFDQLYRKPRREGFRRFS
jgi:hypothetical protein